MNYELRIKQGETFRFPFNVTDNGVVKNLTGYSARMHIRKYPASSTILADVSSHIVINNPTLGQVTITIPPSVTATYDWGHGVYDLELFTAGNADVVTPLEGAVYVVEEITR